MCSVWRLRSRQQQKKIFSALIQSYLNENYELATALAEQTMNWFLDGFFFFFICLYFIGWLMKNCISTKDSKMKSQYLKCGLVDAWVVLNLGLNHHRELTIDCVRIFLSVCELKRVNRYRSSNGRLRVNEENWPNRNVMFNKVQFTVTNQDHEALNQWSKRRRDKKITKRKANSPMKMDKKNLQIKITRMIIDFSMCLRAKKNLKAFIIIVQW